MLCSTQFTLAPLGISFYVCVHARAFGCLACLFLLTYEGASNDTRQAHQVCCERRVEITHSNPQRLVQPERLVACTLTGIVRRLLRLPRSVISRAPAAKPDGSLLEHEQGAPAGRSGQGRKTARRVREARDEAAEAQEDQEQAQAPRAGLRVNNAENLHADLHADFGVVLLTFKNKGGLQAVQSPWPRSSFYLLWATTAENVSMPPVRLMCRPLQHATRSTAQVYRFLKMQIFPPRTLFGIEFPQPNMQGPPRGPCMRPARSMGKEGRRAPGLRQLASSGRRSDGRRREQVIQGLTDEPLPRSDDERGSRRAPPQLRRGSVYMLLLVMLPPALEEAGALGPSRAVPHIRPRSSIVFC